MRVLRFLMLLLAAASLAVPAAARDWTRTVSKTTAGSYVMGNPKAGLQVVEYASFTCGHCGTFHKEAVIPLKAQYIARGLVRFEVRPLVRDVLDMAAVKLARCTTPAGFFAMSAALFEQQPTWIGPYTRLTPEQLRAVEDVPQDRRFQLFAKLGGLDAFARARGLTDQQIDACLADESGGAQLAALKEQARADGVTGTPGILINGVHDKSIKDWTSLEAALRQRLGR